MGRGVLGAVVVWALLLAFWRSRKRFKGSVGKDGGEEVPNDWRQRG